MECLGRCTKTSVGHRSGPNVYVFLPVLPCMVSTKQIPFFAKVVPFQPRWDKIGKASVLTGNHQTNPLAINPGDNRLLISIHSWFSFCNNMLENGQFFGNLSLPKDTWILGWDAAQPHRVSPLTAKTTSAAWKGRFSFAPQTKPRIRKKMMNKYYQILWINISGGDFSMYDGKNVKTCKNIESKSLNAKFGWS